MQTGWMLYHQKVEGSIPDDSRELEDMSEILSAGSKILELVWIVIFDLSVPLEWQQVKVILKPMNFDPILPKIFLV